jgi:hypothetical protein
LCEFAEYGAIERMAFALVAVRSIPLFVRHVLRLRRVADSQSKSEELQLFIVAKAAMQSRASRSVWHTTCLSSSSAAMARVTMRQELQLVQPNHSHIEL